MKKNNSKSVYSMANILYGVTIDTTNFDDIVLAGWQLIGNRETRLYRYTTHTENRRVKLPCNVDFIEAVFSPILDAQTSHPYEIYPNIYNQWTEEYIESWKKNRNVFNERGSLVHYRLEGDTLVLDRDYPSITILYHGVIVDDEGMPYLSDKEVQALAAYCAYMDIYKKSLIRKDGNLFQLASAVKNDWLRLCNSARIPDHITQNEMNDILDVKARWDRKAFGKSFVPII